MKNILKRALSVVLCLAMLMGYLAVLPDFFASSNAMDYDAPVSENWLSGNQSSFEEAVEGWQLSDASKITRTTENAGGDRGSYVLKMVDDLTNDRMRAYRTYDVVPGNHYQTGIDYLSNTEVQLSLTFYDAEGNGILPHPYIAGKEYDGQWHHLGVLAQAPDGAVKMTVTFNTTAGGTGTAYFDNVFVGDYDAEKDPDIDGMVSIKSPGWDEVDFDQVGHPRAYFTADELAALREQVTISGTDEFGYSAKKTYNALIKEAEKYYAETSFRQTFTSNADGYQYDLVEFPDPNTIEEFETPPPGYTGVYAYNYALSASLQERMQTLALAYALTQDAKYAEKVVGYAMKMSAWSHWGQLARETSSGYMEAAGMDTSYLVVGAATVYDMCYDYMTQEQRETLSDAIWNLGLKPLARDLQVYKDHNGWLARLNGLLIGASVIIEESNREDMEEYLTRGYNYAKWFLDYSYTSGQQEGYSYTEHSIDSLIEGIDVLCRVTGKEGFLNHPFLTDVLTDWMLYSMIPGSGKSPAISDMGHDGCFFFRPLMLVNKATGNEKAGLYLKASGILDSGSHLVTPFCKLLYMNPNPVIGDEEDYDQTLTLVDEIGYGYLRSGFGALDVALTMIANDSQHSHNHFDQNSFTLGFNGQLLADDFGYLVIDSGSDHPGYSFGLSYGHNTIFVDGQPQSVKGTGTLSAVVDSDLYGHLLGSAAGAYGGILNQADRHAILLNHADRPYYVIIDELAADAAHIYNWNLYTGGWDTLQVNGNALNLGGSASGNKVTVTKGDSTMTAQFVGKTALSVSAFLQADYEDGPLVQVNSPSSEKYQFMTVLSTATGDMTDVTVLTNYDTATVLGAKISYGSLNDLVLYNRGNETMSAGGAESDASQVVIMGINGSLITEGFTVVDGSSLSFNNGVLFSADGKMTVSVDVRKAAYDATYVTTSAAAARTVSIKAFGNAPYQVTVDGAAVEATYENGMVTFAVPAGEHKVAIVSNHDTHTFDQMIASEAFLKTPGTCSNLAVYYKSCICGEIGEATFTSGKLQHYYEGNKDSGKAASNYTNYIQCDYCDTLKKDDPAAIGAVTIIVDEGTLVYEDFENKLGEGNIPAGWDAFSEGSDVVLGADKMNYVEDENGNAYFISNYNGAAHSGIVIVIPLADKADHTQVQITAEMWMVGYGAPTLRTFFTVYDAEDENLNPWGSSGLPSQENKHFSGIGNTHKTETWYKDINQEGAAYAVFSLAQDKNTDGKVYIDNIRISYNHSYTKVSDQAESILSCTEPAAYYIQCEYCDKLAKDEPNYEGETVRVLEDAMGHNYNAVVTAPTCTSDGYTTYTCANCGDSYQTDVVPSSGHQWIDTEVLTAATCTQEGSKQQACTACGARETVTIEALGHVEEVIPGTEATCTTSGMSDGSRCVRCDTILVEQEVVSALGHSYANKRNSGVLKEAASANSPALYYIACDRCDVLAKDDESYSGVTTVAPNVLVYEDFESGLGADWNKYNEYGALNGSVSVDNGEGDITINSTTVHWGVGTEFSLVNKGAHTQIRITVNYSGAGSLIARTYDVATGTLIKQLFNTPATAEGKTEIAVLDLPEGVENIRLTLLAMKNAGNVTIDAVNVEYVHSYNNQLASDVVASEAVGTKPASYYIKCDHCDALAKDDASYTGAIAKYVGTIVFEDFEDGLPAGWVVSSQYAYADNNSAGSVGTYTDDEGNTWINIFKVDGVSGHRGVATKFSIADAGEHTQIRVTFDYYGAGGLLAEVYNENGTATYVERFANVGVTANVQKMDKTIELSKFTTEIIQLRLLINGNIATSNVYIDNVKVEFVHSYAQQLVGDELASEATCDSPAAYYIKCDYCDALAKDDASYTGETTKASGESMGHTEGTPVVENNVDATCTTAGGYDTVITCTVCKQVISSVHTEVPAKGHAYVATVTAPTCTDAGFTTYECVLCGDSYVGDNVDALGHSYAAEVTAPTCDAAGYTTYTCSACGDSYVDDNVDALGHNYAADVTAPTCTDAGYTTYTCSACGDSYVGDNVDALGHTAGEAVKENQVAGTCTTPGTWEDVVYCSVCHTEMSREAKESDALGHAWDAGVYTDPTEEADGYTTYTCNGCGETKVEIDEGSQLTRPTAEESILVDEDFESGLSADWNKYSEYGVVNGSVSVDNGEGYITINTTTVHWGVGTEFSVANKGAHTQIRITVNYSGTGSLIARTYDVATGTLIKQLYNTPATAEGKTETAVLDLPEGVENIRLTLLALRNADSVTIDSVKVEYVHSYDQQLVGNELASEATASKPAAYYIECDHCGALAKDDASYNGATVKYVGVIYYDDFEYTAAGDKKLPADWTAVSGYGSYGIAEDGDNSYFYIHNTHATASSGMKINLDLGDYGTHTKVVISMMVKGGGDFAGVLQSSFMVYNAEGIWINNNTSGNSYAYNSNFNNVTWEDWTQITIVKDIVVQQNVAGDGVDNKGATVTWQLVQRYGATAPVYIDDIHVDVIHSYDQQLVSDKIATEATCDSPATYYIKCDGCDKTGEITKTVGEALGHAEGTPVVENNVGATCTVDGGYDTVVYCTVCNEEISRIHTTVPALGHAWTDGICGTCGAECEHDFVDGTCTICGKVDATCAHAETKTEIENMIESTNTVVGSYDEVVYCAECGAEISRESKAALLNPFQNQSFNLESQIALNINIKWDTLDADELAAEGYYVVITKIDANGVAHDTTIPMSEWEKRSQNRYRFAYDQFAAKEMMDTIQWAVYNSANEQVSVVYEFTIAEFVLEQINLGLASNMPEYVTLLVDMLNYGAAAQKYFKYNQNNYANTVLPDGYQAYATQNTVYGAAYDNSGFAAYQTMALQLESRIEMSFVFYNDAFGVDLSQVVATVTYTTHTGTVVTKEINGTDFGYRSPKNGRERCQLTIDWLAIADGAQEVTVEFTDLQGNALGTVKDAVQNLAGSWSEQLSDELYPAIVKFMSSAYAYFH